MALEGKRISELTEVSRVNKSSKLPIDTGGEEALSITLENLMESGVNAAIEALQFITWVDVLPPTGSTKYLYAVPREEVDKDGHKIAALYLWDGTEWRGAGAFSLNIDPDTLATKNELAGYLPLSGGTLSGNLHFPRAYSDRYSIQNGYSVASFENPFLIFGNNAYISLLDTRDEHIKFRKRSTGNTQYELLSVLDKAVANGVASLDENAKVPENQLPDAVATKTDLDKYLPLIGGDMGQNLFTYNYENNKIYYYWNKLFNVVDLPVNSWSIFLIVCKRDFNSVFSYSSLLYVSRYAQNNSYSIILTPISAFSNNTDESNICVATDADKNVYVQGRPSWGGTQNGAFKIVKLVGSVDFTPENAGQADFGEAPTGITFLSKITDSGAYRVNLTDNSVTNYEDSANLLKLTAKYAINDKNGNNILTTYATNEKLAAKQDKLIAGTNITIEGNVISATGGSTTAGRPLGEVFFSQSSLATDNPGALPGWTGEYYTNASTLYPDFYSWVKSHTELCKTKAEYDSAIATYGECPYYVADEVSGSLRLPKLSNYIKMANSTDGITQKGAGLPDHIHNIVGSANYSGTINNAFGNGTTNPATLSNIIKPASESNSIYGDSDTVQPAHTTLYPWISAYTSAIPASVAQASEFTGALAGKANTDLSNIPMGYDYVIESKFPTTDDTSWYRLYKSGWLEQGNVSPAKTGDSSGFTLNTTITFPKPFADNNYTLIGPGFVIVNGGRQDVTKTATGFTTSSIANNCGTSYWYACGIGAN